MGVLAAQPEARAGGRERGRGSSIEEDSARRGWSRRHLAESLVVEVAVVAALSAIVRRSPRRDRRHLVDVGADCDMAFAFLGADRDGVECSGGLVDDGLGLGDRGAEPE